MPKNKKTIPLISLFAISTSLTSCDVFNKINPPSIDDEKKEPTNTDTDLDGVTFSNESFKYDGDKHYLQVNSLPDYIEVTYIGNGQSNPGEYNVIAQFFNINTKTFYEKTLTAVLTIVDISHESSSLDAKLAKVVFNDRTIEYNGSTPRVKVENLPDGYDVTYSALRLSDSKEIDLSQAIDADSYIVYGKISKNGQLVFNKSCILKITPKQLTLNNVYFKSQSYAYNGTVRTLKLTDYNNNDVVLSDGTLKRTVNSNGKLLQTINGVVEKNGKEDEIYITVAYSNNGKMNAGQHVVNASFYCYSDSAHTIESKNYTAPNTISATLTIVDSLSHSVTFINAAGTQILKIDNVLDGSSVDESLIPDYIPSNPKAYKKVYDSTQLTNIREDKVVTVTYEANVFNITYVISHGVSNGSNPSSYSYEDEDITLLEPTINDGYVFEYYYYLNENNQEVKIDTIKKNTVGDYTIFAKVTALDQNNSGITVKDKFVTYDGKQVEADVTDNSLGASTYQIYYTDSNGVETTTAPTEVGVYQVRVEVTSTIDDKIVKYKDSTALLVISKKKVTIDQDNDILVYSNGGREVLVKDQNGVYSLVRNGENLIEREYDENSPVYVSLGRNAPSYLNVSVTYSDYQGNIYKDGFLKAGSYIATLSFSTSNSNYEVLEDIMVQVKIAKKKITLSESEISNNIFSDKEEVYRENTTYTLTASNFDRNGYSEEYPNFRVLRYLNNSVNGVTSEDNYATIYLTNIDDNYDLYIDGNSSSRYGLGLDAITGNKYIYYNAKFIVRLVQDTKSVNYVYQNIAGDFENDLTGVSVVIGKKAGYKNVTEELFNKINKDDINNSYYWNTYDWVLARKQGNSYIEITDNDGNNISISDYTISDSSDDNLYFLLKATKKTFKITYLDDTGLVNKSDLNNLNVDSTKNTHSYGKDITINLNSTDLYQVVYYYTDINNPSGSQIKNNILDDSYASDLNVYVYAISKDYTSGKEVVFDVIKGDYLIFNSSNEITNLDRTNFKAGAFGSIFVGKNKNFRVYSDPEVIGMRFRGWYTVDSDGRLTSETLVNSSTLLTEEMITNNSKYFSDGKIHVFAVFDNEKYNIHIDLNNGSSFTVDNIDYKGGLTAKNREDIISAVKDACPNGYSTDESTFKFLNDTGTNLNILSSSFVFSYTKDLILTVVYQVREIQINFYLPETPANGLKRELVKTITEKHGDYFVLPDNASRDGYTFNGWLLNLNGNDTYIYSNTIVDLSNIATNVTSLDITAVMSLNRYKISIVTSSDSTVEETYINYGAEFNVDTYFTTPTKKGYVFTDWYYGNSRLRDLVPERKYTFTSDIIIYAHYRSKKFNITFYNGQSILRDLSGYTVQYGQIFSLPSDNGFVSGKELEGYYLDSDFNYKITSSILCVDNADANFFPSNLVDSTGTINIYAKFTPKKYNMTLIMETYTDPLTGKTFKTETVQMEYGVTGNLYKYLTDNYSELNSYSGPYTAGKVFKSWNVGYATLDMSETNLTYNYDFDIVVTCQYTGKTLGNTTYYWLTEDGYLGQTYSGKYDDRSINAKEAVYGSSISSVTLTSIDAKNQMLNGLKAKTGASNPATDVSISSWYYLKDGEVIDQNRPIDLSQWVLADSDSLISNSQSLTLLCVFSRPSYPVTIYNELEDKQISYQVHGNDSNFKIHNNTPYNVEMTATKNAEGLNVYTYKYYELFFDEEGNRIPTQSYITFEIVESADVTFDGRLFRLSTSENGKPVEWSFKKVPNTTNKYQLTGDYQTFTEFKNANVSYLGFSDSSNIIITPIMSEKNSVQIYFYKLNDSATDLTVASHISIKKNSNYTFPSDTPSDIGSKTFAGWALWNETRDPTADDCIYKDGDHLYDAGGTYSTYSDTVRLVYIAKYKYNSVYISWKINGDIIDDNTHQDIEIDPADFANKNITWDNREIVLDHYKYTKFKFVDENGENLNIEAKYDANGKRLPTSYESLLQTGKSRIYIIPDNETADYREYIGLTISYQIQYDDITGSGSRTSFYGPFIIDKTDTLTLYNPNQYIDASLDLAKYGFGFIYDNPITGGDKYLKADQTLTSADLEKITESSIVLKGYQVYFNSTTDIHNLTISTAGDVTINNVNGGRLFVPSIVYDETSKTTIKTNRLIGFSTAMTTANKNALRTITMSNNITIIAQNAFKDAQYLLTIRFSDNITTIGLNSFENCFRLKNLTFPSSLNSIMNYAFHNTYSLDNITFNKNLTRIGDYAFFVDSTYNPNETNTKQYLQSLMFGRNITSIGKYAFANRYSLKEVYWDELKTREFDQYDSNHDLIELNLTGDDLNYIDGANVTIGDYAFALTISSTSTTVPKDYGTKTTGFDGYAKNETYKYTPTRFEADKFCRIVLPRNLTTIGEGAFIYRTYTNFVFTDAYNTASSTTDRSFNALTIGESAFYIRNIDTAFEKYNIVIPTNTTTISERAFRNRVYISKGIVFNNPGLSNMSKYQLTIGEAAFSNSSTNLTSGNENFCPRKRISADNKFEMTLPDRLVSIADYAFLEVTNIDNLKLAANISSSSLTSIGKWAFGINYMADGDYSTDNDQYDDYPSIGFGSVKGWNVDIPASLTSIGEYCFYQRSILRTLNVVGGYKSTNNSKLVSIGERAFYSCRNLTTIGNGFSNELTTLGSYAFARCNNLIGESRADRTFYLSNKITTIPEGVFYCTAFTNFRALASEIAYVSSYAFYHCTNLVNFGTANGANNMYVKQVGDYSFAYCSKLTNHVLKADCFSVGTTRSGSTVYIPPIDNLKILYRSTNYKNGYEVYTKIGGDSKGYNLDIFDTYSRASSVSGDAPAGIRGSFSSVSKSYTIEKRGSQLGVGAFMYCSQLSFSGSVLTSFSCVNPYTFARCTNLTKNNNIDWMFPLLFNISPSSSSRSTRYWSSDNYSTICTNAFIGSNARVGTYKSSGENGHSSSDTRLGGYELFIYTEDIEPFGLNGLSIYAGSYNICQDPFAYYGNYESEWGNNMKMPYKYSVRWSNCARVRIGVSNVRPMFLSGLGGSNYVVTNAEFQTRYGSSAKRMTNVYSLAFYNCTNLIGFYMPCARDKGNYIFTGAFSGASNLNQIGLPYGTSCIYYNGMISNSGLSALQSGKNEREWSDSLCNVYIYKDYKNGDRYEMGLSAGALENVRYPSSSMYKDGSYKDYRGGDCYRIFYSNKDYYMCSPSDFEGKDTGDKGAQYRTSLAYNK